MGDGITHLWASRSAKDRAWPLPVSSTEPSAQGWGLPGGSLPCECPPGCQFAPPHLVGSPGGQGQDHPPRDVHRAWVEELNTCAGLPSS